VLLVRKENLLGDFVPTRCLSTALGRQSIIRNVICLFLKLNWPLIVVNIDFDGGVEGFFLSLVGDLGHFDTA